MRECPITLETMTVPVKTEHGHIYEFSELARVLISDNSTDPMTRLTITSLTLSDEDRDPNKTLTQEEREKIARLLRQLSRSPYNITLNQIDTIEGIQAIHNARPDAEKIWDAAEAGHCQTVRKLLQNPAFNPDTKNEDEVTPFWVAAYQGHHQVLRIMLDEPRINPNEDGEFSMSPLAIAAHENHLKAMKLLLDSPRVRANRQDIEERTALYFATDHNHIDAVKLLLSYDTVDFNLADEEGRTPLFVAAYHGHTEIVAELLAKNQLQVNQPNLDQETPLLMAVNNGHEATVRLLLADARIHPNLARNRTTPLMLALEHEHDLIMRHMLSYDAIVHHFIQQLSHNDETSPLNNPALLNRLASYQTLIWETLKNPTFMSLTVEAHHALLKTVIERCEENPGHALNTLFKAATSPTLYPEPGILSEMKTLVDAYETDRPQKRLKISEGSTI